MKEHEPAPSLSYTFTPADLFVEPAIDSRLRAAYEEAMAAATEFLKHGTFSEAWKAKMRLKDIDSTLPKEPLSLEEIWRKRDEDKHHPGFHEVWYSEETRRRFERKLGRVVTRADVETILRALLNGEIELR